MAYPLPNNLTTMYGAMSYADTVSEGVFILLIPFSLWVIITIFLSLRGYRFFNCAVAAGYTSVVVTIFLFWAGLMSPAPLALIVLASFAIPLVAAYLQSE